MPRLLLVDDSAAFRGAARRALLGSFEIHEAVDGESAIELARRLRPDVVLLDVQLPGSDGFHVAAVLTAGKNPPTVILTSSLDRSDVDSLLPSSGATAFIPKEQLTARAILALLP